MRSSAHHGQWFMTVLSVLLLTPGTGSAKVAAAQQDRQADFCVAPGGDDAWSGRFPAPTADKKDGPFATLPGSRRRAMLALKGEATFRCSSAGGLTASRDRRLLARGLARDGKR